MIRKRSARSVPGAKRVDAPLAELLGCDDDEDGLGAVPVGVLDERGRSAPQDGQTTAVFSAGAEQRGQRSAIVVGADLL
jgi:hypothetical protein